MAKTVKTPAGTELSLISLKGKDYMMVAQRLIWFNEVASRFEIDSQVLKLDDNSATVSTVVAVYDDKGQLLKKARGTKTESKKDFPDFLEKAETGSLGRALAMMGYGTQFALADLDEGDRIVDSPVAAIPKTTLAASATGNTATVVKNTESTPAPFQTRSRRKAVENEKSTNDDI